MARTQRSGLGLGFLSTLFPKNPKRFFFFFFFFLQAAWLKMNVPYARQNLRTWLKQIISSSSRFSKTISLYSHSLAACSDFWTLLRRAWVLNAGPHPAQSLLFSRHYRSTSTTVFFPSTHCALLYSCAVVVNKACPLASSSLWSPPLCWGRNCGRATVCRSSAASCTASLLHLHKIDLGFLVKQTGQDWLCFHL